MAFGDTGGVNNQPVALSDTDGVNNQPVALSDTDGVNNQLWLLVTLAVSITYLWPFSATDFSVAISSPNNYDYLQALVNNVVTWQSSCVIANNARKQQKLFVQGYNLEVHDVHVKTRKHHFRATKCNRCLNVTGAYVIKLCDSK